MAIVLDLRQGAPAEDQLIYIKEQLERHLTELEDSVGGVKSVETVLMDDNTIKLIITDNDGNKTEEEIRNAAGVKNIITQYYLSESYLDQSGGEWTESQPAWADGYYLWQRTKITWDDGTSSSTTPRLLTAVNDACERATTAQTTAGEAKTTATAAQATANAAQTSASAARTAAEEAKSSATAAATAASAAQTRADDAYTYAGQAKSAADDADAHALTAKNRADEAYTYAGQAATSASEAKTQATAATSYANGALTGLSTVQDVIGVLDWAQKNAQYTLTSDTDIVPGKTYWTRSGSGTEADPYTYAPVVNPVKTQLSNYYEISGVDEAMADYINTHLALLEDGLYVLSDNSGWKVRIANDGVYIIDPQGNTATKYKDAVTLGNDDGSQSYQYLDYHSMQLIDKEGSPYFYISDLRDSSGYVIIEEYFRTDGISNRFTTMLKISEVLDISAYGVSDPPVYSINYKTITFDEVPAKKVAGVYVRYKTNDRNAKAFTLGTRDQFGVVGPMSFAEGDNITASGLYSHAEGSFTIAHGESSHAEGDSTNAGGKNSHAEGYHSMANGLRSHAQNFETIASGLNQTALGRYNIEDNDDTYSVIIGNGTNDNNRSNALTVDWQGNVWAGGTVTAEDMTDAEITNFIDRIPGGSSLLDYEVVPVTLTNDYTLASWGYIKAYRFGYICMLTFSGLKRSTATTSNTQFASIPFTVMENMTTSAVDGAGDTAIVQAMKDTSEIYINAANANANYFGQLIFIVG